MYLYPPLIPWFFTLPVAVNHVLGSWAGFWAIARLHSKASRLVFQLVELRPHQLEGSLGMMPSMCLSDLTVLRAGSYHLQQTYLI